MQSSDDEFERLYQIAQTKLNRKKVNKDIQGYSLRQVEQLYNLSMYKLRWFENDELSQYRKILLDFQAKTNFVDLKIIIDDFHEKIRAKYVHKFEKHNAIKLHNQNCKDAVTLKNITLKLYDLEQTILNIDNSIKINKFKRKFKANLKNPSRAVQELIDVANE